MKPARRVDRLTAALRDLYDAFQDVTTDELAGLVPDVLATARAALAAGVSPPREDAK